MMRGLQIFMWFLQLGLAASKYNIYIDTSMPDHPYPVIRHSKLIFSFFFGLEVFIEIEGGIYIW